MSFGQPWGLLFFLLFIPVVLLYMLKQRRRPVEVPTLLFWDKILQDQQSITSRTRLRKWLSLFLQLLLISLLSLAFSRPSLSNSHEGRRLILLIDTSASMGVKEKGGTRFELARKEAARVIRGLSAGDQAALIGFNTETEVLHPLTDNKKSLLASLDLLHPTLLSSDWNKTRFYIDHLPENKKETHVVVISDGTGPALKPVAGSKVRLSFLDVGDEQSNVGITSFAVRPITGSPRDVQVHLEIANETDQARRVPVEFRLDGRLLDAFEFSIEPHAHARKTLKHLLPQGGELEVIADFPDAFPLDNRAYAVVTPPRKMPVLLVGRDIPFLDQVLATDEDVDLTRVEPENFKPLVGPGVMVFSGWHPNQTPAGHSIFVGQWPADLGISKKGDLARPLITDWQRDHPVNRHLSLQNITIQKAQALQAPRDFQDLVTSFEDPLVLFREREGQKTLVTAFETSETDLPLRVAFPILMGNALRYLLMSSHSSEAAIPPGSSLTVEELQRLTRASLSQTSEALALLDPEGKKHAFQNRRVISTEQSGIYRVVTREGTNALFAVNLLSGSESRIRKSPRDDKSADLFKPSWANLGFGFEPWVILVLAASLLCVTEWFLFHRRLTE